jgi:hypothetical protein
LKMNFIGIMGGILGFVGLVLPWWTMTVSSSYGGTSAAADISIYLYRATISGPGISESQGTAWYGYSVMAILLIGSVIAITGSVITTKRKALLAAGGALALVAVILFPVAFQLDISNALANTAGVVPSGLNVGLFVSDSFDYQGYITLNYSSYLSFGFWLALTGAILMLVAAIRKIPAEAPLAVYSAPPPPPPPLQ